MVSELLSQRSTSWCFFIKNWLLFVLKKNLRVAALGNTTLDPLWVGAIIYLATLQRSNIFANDVFENMYSESMGKSIGHLNDCKTRFLTISQHHFKTHAKTLTEHTTKHRNQHHGTQDAVTGASETPMTTELHVAVFFIACVCLSHSMTRATNAPHGPYWFRTTTDQCWIQKRCGPKGADRPWRPEKAGRWPGSSVTAQRGAVCSFFFCFFGASN